MGPTGCSEMSENNYQHKLRTGQLKCDGTRAETRFRLSAKRKSPFKSAGASVQWTTGSRGVRISGSNAGYTMFRGSLPCTSPTMRHRVPSHFNWNLPILKKDDPMHTTKSFNSKIVTEEMTG